MSVVPDLLPVHRLTVCCGIILSRGWFAAVEVDTRILST